MKDKFINLLPSQGLLSSENIFAPALEHIFRSPEPTLWVFGYGSLIWNPGFRYKAAVRGYVEDYDRKFWQGNFTHRGSKDLPGRVVTIVPEPGKQSFGLVFKVTGLENIIAALEHLFVREIKSGYKFQTVTVKCMDSIANAHYFHPEAVAQLPYVESLSLEMTSTAAIGRRHADAAEQTIEALTCVALPENCYFVGPGENMDSVASQIAQAQGPAGPNSEYLLKLAESMKGHFPGIRDGHLFELEELVYNHLIRLTGAPIDCACDIRGVRYLPGERVRLPPLPSGLTINDLSL